MDFEFNAVNTLWVLLGAALVFFMQAGFAMVETGFTRAKNAGNIIMKNLMDFSIGTPLYWLVGFGLMFGASMGGFIGEYAGVASAAHYGGIAATLAENGVPLWAFIAFQTMFCATTATIVSGAMAERTKFSAYCIYSAVISLLIYPIEAHWIWGGGFLSQMGFHDFAGSTAVHMCGGTAALIGAAFLGPRIGKYHGKKAKAIPGHSLTLGALGVFILWFGWFGFNPTSSLAVEGVEELVGKIFLTTNLSAAVAACATMLFTWVWYKKPDVSMTLNGALAGLVAITAGCDAVTPLGAAIIGLVAGILVVLAITFVDQVLRVDDPVGAVGVHGVSGAVGTLMVGLFADGSTTEAGLFYGGGAHLLGVQALGVVCVLGWMAITMTAVFLIIKHTIGLRVSEEEELLGLDSSEHGLSSAYADFAAAPGSIQPFAAPVPPERAVPVVVADYADEASDDRFTKVAIVCKQERFELLKQALGDIGVSGITVTQVLGCGLQKGRPEYYRGVPLDFTLLPKIKVEVVVCRVPVRAVIEAAKQALYTGHIGDGKIFVYGVENVVKVRTGEEGVAALQDSADE